MSITRAKSIDSLYQDCKDFDLVLVPDAPMASALNRRLDKPHFGPFAITPRRLAARRREQAEDRLAFLEIIQTTDLNWKEASYAVGNILQCWEYQGTAEAVLEYDQFATAATRTAVNCITEIDRECVTTVDTSKVDEALEVTDLSESDLYEIDGSQYVRKADVDQEVKESRHQGLKDQLAAESPETDELHQEIEELEARIDEPTSITSTSETD